ncbi:MAG TPA: tyrosine-type recombinase/integrase [Terriglobales bacterium]|nr:tyrosine-type recombinase/integrase [Terriglobales bacterium]
MNATGGNLKDIRTVHVQTWLDQIGKEQLKSKRGGEKKALSRNSLKRIKSVISGAFKEAKRLGFFDGINPVKDTAVNPRAAEAADTYAYDLEEILGFLAVLPEPANTAFAVAAFAGLRRGEIEALNWPDYHDGQLHVSQSVWNGRMTEAKSKASCAPVPVIKHLAERLEIHRLRCGNPTDGPIFRNTDGGHLNMNNLRNRVILPALNRCVHCGRNEGVDHVKQDHDHKYERDPSRPEWHGFHAARRGLASNLYRLGVPDKTIQAILRHENVSTTLACYVKTASPDVMDGMQKLEEKVDREIAEKLEASRSRDISRTAKPTSDAQPEFVN